MSACKLIIRESIAYSIDLVDEVHFYIARTDEIFHSIVAQTTNPVLAEVFGRNTFPLELLQDRDGILIRYGKATLAKENSSSHCRPM